MEEVKCIARLGVISEIVLIFHSLSLGLREFYDLRHALGHLPACCLSRSTFVVALNKWANNNNNNNNNNKALPQLTQVGRAVALASTHGRRLGDVPEKLVPYSGNNLNRATWPKKDKRLCSMIHRRLMRARAGTGW
jgi:hypothetical protein